jgi:hypothetical protein
MRAGDVKKVITWSRGLFDSKSYNDRTIQDSAKFMCIVLSLAFFSLRRYLSWLREFVRTDKKFIIRASERRYREIKIEKQHEKMLLVSLKATGEKWGEWGEWGEQHSLVLTSFSWSDWFCRTKTNDCQIHPLVVTSSSKSLHACGTRSSGRPISCRKAL